MNPAFRTSSPQPSTFESHHDPNSMLAKELNPGSRQQSEDRDFARTQPSSLRSSQNQVPPNPYEDMPKVPHNEYPMDGMTQFCRIGPPSERSSIPSPTRPDSSDDRSEYSNPTSYSSYEPSTGQHSPVKQFSESGGDDRGIQKKKSGFFQNHSPFRRRSKQERDQPQSSSATPTARNTWAPPSGNSQVGSPGRPFGRQARNVGFGNEAAASPDPDAADPRANFQLNVGNNVFDVASPDNRRKPPTMRGAPDLDDPIAAALAELKGVTKQTSVRQSADRYHGIATPAPSNTPGPGDRSSAAAIPKPFADRSTGRTPPPSYDQQPVSRLGAPQPAFTSRQMQQTTANYVNQGRDMFNPPNRQGGYEQRSQSAMGSRPTSRDGRPSDIPRATSPAPLRGTSPRPQQMAGDRRSQQPMPRAASPNPYGGPPQNGPGHNRPRSHSQAPMGMGQGGPNQPHNQMPRSHSPQPHFGPGPSGPGGNMALQLAPGPDGGYGSSPQRGRGSFNEGGPQGRPTSQMYGEGPYAATGGPNGGQMTASRNRSQSQAGHRQVTKDGRPILHFGKSYQGTTVMEHEC